MKSLKIAMRLWLALTSLVVFVTSWVVLAHAPKPNQSKPAEIRPMPALPPVPSIDQLLSQDDGPRFQLAQPQQQPMVRLRTSGS